MDAQEINKQDEKIVQEASLLDEITELTTKSKGEDYQRTKDNISTGLKELFRHIMKSGKKIKISKKVVDEIISEIDSKMSRQLDAILHHKDFQKLESSWRSLKFLVDRTDFRQKINIEMLNASKEDLIDDLCDPDIADITYSSLYEKIYSSEYGLFGGEPYGAIIGNYDFTHGSHDIELLEKIASISSMSHAPFIAAASPNMFKENDFSGVGTIKDFETRFNSLDYTKWKSFRDSEDARYVGLTAPRFLLRLPYSPENKAIKSFSYTETTPSNDEYVWGNTAFAFASKLTDSFAKYRWCSNIIGPKSGGTVEDLPIHQYTEDGLKQTKIPTEVHITERQETQLAEQGFIPLTMRKGSDNAAFFSANSTQKLKDFPDTKEGKEASVNFQLGSQLPYMFIINRMAHYVKMFQRENIGSWKDKKKLETELNKWIRQYVSDQENPPPELRSKKPLRKAKIYVDDVPGEAGWYKVRMELTPQFKYMGAYFTLSLTGKLDTDED
ncbi:type VI secretion protein [Candidatus Magnetomorum sp. HK-1]|nr:type VI secretion protein [Candidatus Magnetomorum sp. HK-1]